MQDKEHNSSPIAGNNEDLQPGISSPERVDGFPAPVTLPLDGVEESPRGEALPGGALRERWVRLIDSLDY